MDSRKGRGVRAEPQRATIKEWRAARNPYKKVPVAEGEGEPGSCGLTKVQEGNFKKESGQQCQVSRESKEGKPGDNLLDLALGDHQ